MGQKSHGRLASLISTGLGISVARCTSWFCRYSVWVGSFPCTPIQILHLDFHCLQCKIKSQWTAACGSGLDQGYTRTFSFFLSALHSTVGTMWCDRMVSDDAHLAVDHTNLGLCRTAVEQRLKQWECLA